MDLGIPSPGHHSHQGALLRKQTRTLAHPAHYIHLVFHFPLSVVSLEATRSEGSGAEPKSATAPRLHHEAALGVPLHSHLLQKSQTLASRPSPPL